MTPVVICIHKIHRSFKEKLVVTPCFARKLWKHQLWILPGFTLCILGGFTLDVFTIHMHPGRIHMHPQNVNCESSPSRIHDSHNSCHVNCESPPGLTISETQSMHILGGFTSTLKMSTVNPPSRIPQKLISWSCFAQR